MRLNEAREKVQEGFRITRDSWLQPSYLTVDTNGFWIISYPYGDARLYEMTDKDVGATDWTTEWRTDRK